MSDFRAVAHLEEQLGEKCWQDLISSENTGKIKQFLESLQLLLTPAGTITVRLATELNVGDFFKVNIKKNAPVKISFIGDNFKSWFLSPRSASKTVAGGGPYREPGVQNGATESDLRYHTLNRRSVDGPIIDQLGGEAKAETAIAEVCALLEKQANGEEGVLLTNGYWNIFYVRDGTGVLRAVGVRWDGDGWGVDALSVGNPGEWGAGYRVFSR